MGWIFIPAAAVAATISGTIGWYLARGFFSEELELPGWLEAAAPLKGRWLRVLLSSPVVLGSVLLTFAVVFFNMAVVLVILAVALSALLGVRLG